MAFRYCWKNREANFGKPLKLQVKGGTHVTFEIIQTYKGKIIAPRRKSIPGHEEPPDSAKHPEGMLFFCHNFIRFAEPMDKFVRRVVMEQAGAGVKKWRTVNFESFFQKKDGQWALLGYVAAELSSMPRKGVHGNEVGEVILFTPKNIPAGFAWWGRSEVKDFIKEHMKNENK